MQLSPSELGPVGSQQFCAGCQHCSCVADLVFFFVLFFCVCVIVVFVFFLGGGGSQRLMLALKHGHTIVFRLNHTEENYEYISAFRQR